MKNQLTNELYYGIIYITNKKDYTEKATKELNLKYNMR